MAVAAQAENETRGLAGDPAIDSARSTDSTGLPQTENGPQNTLNTRKVGRPTKLTPELIERVCRFIRAGSFIESAALGCGITRQTFYAWMRAGHAARDDRLAHNQRGPGAGEFVLTPEEERCVEFIDAMDEALSTAENRWVCGIVEAGERDWKAFAWRADRRTRLPHGYRACGEWDQGANESTLSGIRERQAARVEWQRKMQARVAAMEAVEAAADAAEDAERGRRGDAEMAADAAESRIQNSESRRSELGGEESGARSQEGKLKGQKDQGTKGPKAAEKGEDASAFAQGYGETGGEAKLQAADGPKDQRTKGPKGDEKVAVAQKDAAGVVGKVVGKHGGFIASVVLLLGLWVMGGADAATDAAAESRIQNSESRSSEVITEARKSGNTEPRVNARGYVRRWANESGFQPWGFGRRGSWAVGPGWDEGAPLALWEHARNPEFRIPNPEGSGIPDGLLRRGASRNDRRESGTGGVGPFDAGSALAQGSFAKPQEEV